MATKKTLYMETTEIAAEKTAGEIISALVTAGATQINTEFEAGKIKGLRWIMRISGQDVLFAMPARIEPIYQIFYNRQTSYVNNEAKERLREKAQRVAWRQLLRWVQAQLAMVECGMAEQAEVFFPYIQTGRGQNLFDVFKERGLKMIAGPEERAQ